MQLSDFFGFDITPFTSIKEFADGESIIKADEVPRYLYYLERGRAKLYLPHSNGKRTLVNFIEAPCFIGEMELLGEQREADSVICITTCTCTVIDIASCRDQILGDVTFLNYLCKYLIQKARKNTDHYSKNQSYPLENRLAKFILLTENHGFYREKHTEAADYLGVTYRHLLFVVAEFKKQGILEKTPQGYRIKDLIRLQELAI